MRKMTAISTTAWMTSAMTVAHPAAHAVRCPACCRQTGHRLGLPTTPVPFLRRRACLASDPPMVGLEGFIQEVPTSHTSLSTSTECTKPSSWIV